MPKTTIVLDAELHRALRHLAVDLGISFQQLAVSALEEYLERQRRGVSAAGQARRPKKR